MLRWQRFLFHLFENRVRCFHSEIRVLLVDVVSFVTVHTPISVNSAAAIFTVLIAHTARVLWFHRAAALTFAPPTIGSQDSIFPPTGLSPTRGDVIRQPVHRTRFAFRYSTNTASDPQNGQGSSSSEPGTSWSISSPETTAGILILLIISTPMRLVQRFQSFQDRSIPISRSASSASEFASDSEQRWVIPFG